MTENDQKPNSSENEIEMIEFPAENAETLSSQEFLKTGNGADDETPVEPAAEQDPSETDIERSPEFDLLSKPTLPILESENRGKLLMQSPNMLYFYWSLKGDPYKRIGSALGNSSGNYTLVLKLVDLDTEAEEIHQVGREGSWWFAVASDARYRAEIGFYSPNRPYIRILFSNEVATPRKRPSAHIATDADWAVPAAKFSEVLDVAGFKQDAFEVAMVGDDIEYADNAARKAFGELLPSTDEYVSVNAEELRFALLALASGMSLESLRGKIDPKLYSILEAGAEKVAAEKALSLLRKYFDIADEEYFEETGSRVFGASIVNFPVRVARRRTRLGDLDKLNPLSSHSVAKDS